MKNLTKLLLIPIAIFSFIACNKKKDDIPAPSSKTSSITGTWKVIQYADDDNKNSKMDESEKYPIDSTDEQVLMFKSDGSGIQYERSGSYRDTVIFMWQLKNNDNNISIVSQLDSGSFFIESLSQQDFVLRIEEQPSSWIIMKKQ